MIHYKDFNKKNHKFLLDKKDKTRKKNFYCNNIFTFDLETSTVFVNPETGEHMNFKYDKTLEQGKMPKYSYVYIWQFSIDDTVYYGRYLEEFNDFIVNYIHPCLKDRKATIFVHNLAYEFQFLRNIFAFSLVFARTERKPIYCDVKDLNLRFRCSYLMTNKSLDTIANVYKLEVKKLDYDYNKIRTSETPLTEDELLYCKNDCLVLYEYIKLFELSRFGKVHRIPLTSTGKIRERFKNHINKTDSSQIQYWKKNITQHIPNGERFIQLSKTFQGGYTHANPLSVEKVHKNVKSIDFTSSYPYTMLTEKFPMGSFNYLEDDEYDINNLDQNKAYLINLTLHNIRAVKAFTYISNHKAYRTEGVTLDNGRIYSAKLVSLWCTEIDLEIIKECYDIEEIEVESISQANKKYLPKEFIEFILTLAEEKQYYKSLYKKEPNDTNYVLMVESKEFLNALYGMCVTNTLKDEIDFNNGEWGKTPLTRAVLDELLRERKLKPKELLPYQWGVWITAYSRLNLFKALYFADSEAHYTDTDSIKYNTSFKAMDDYINDYNIECEEKLLKMADFYKIVLSKTILGLGKFDDDGDYREFITLGSKKYAYRTQEGDLKQVVSGINRKTGYKALNDDIRNFKRGWFYNYEYANKNMCQYLEENDKYVKGQKYGVAIFPDTYKLDITEEFSDHIKRIANNIFDKSYLN